MPRLAGFLEHVGMTLACRDEWTWLGKSEGESITDRNWQGKESRLAQQGAFLFILQMASPHPSDCFILSPGQDPAG